jgi:hypothetical protein
LQGPRIIFSRAEFISKENEDKCVIAKAEEDKEYMNCELYAGNLDAKPVPLSTDLD